MKKKLLLAILLCFAAAGCAFAEAKESTLEADELNYNVQTKAASATGNVVFTRGGEIAKGDHAEGFIDKHISVTGKPVVVVSEIHKTTLTAKRIDWTTVSDDRKQDYYEAFGTVRARRTNGDFLNSEYVKVSADYKVLDATGGVELLYEGKYLKGLEVHRNGADFNGKNIARLEDRVKKYALSAATVAGKINEKDKITDAVADKNVVFNHVDKNGLKSRLYGDHAVYNKAAGTLTVTGNAHGLRQDGKKIRADKLVYHEATELIEAIGRTKITFVNDK